MASNNSLDKYHRLTMYANAQEQAMWKDLKQEAEIKGMTLSEYAYQLITTYWSDRPVEREVNLDVDGQMYWGYVR